MRLVLGHQVRVGCTAERDDDDDENDDDNDSQRVNEACRHGCQRCRRGFGRWWHLGCCCPCPPRKEGEQQMVNPNRGRGEIGSGITPQVVESGAASRAWGGGFQSPASDFVGVQRYRVGSDALDAGLEAGLLNSDEVDLGDIIALRCFRFQEDNRPLPRSSDSKEDMNDATSSIGLVGSDTASDLHEPQPLRRAASGGSFHSVSLNSEPYRKDSLLGRGAASVVSGASSSMDVGAEAPFEGHSYADNESVSVGAAETTMRWTVRRTAREFRVFVGDVITLLGPKASEELDIPRSLIPSSSWLRAVTLILPFSLVRMLGVDFRIDAVQAEAFLGELLEFCAHSAQSQATCSSPTSIDLSPSAAAVVAPDQDPFQHVKLDALDRVLSEFLGLSVASTLSSLGCEGRLEESYLRKRPMYSANDMRSTNGIVALQILAALSGITLALRVQSVVLLLGTSLALGLLGFLDLWLTRPSEPNRAWLLPGLFIFPPAVAAYLFYARCVRQDNVRWFVLRESYIAYYDSSYDTAPRGVFLLDHRSKLEPRALGALGGDSHLVRVSNADSTLSLLATSRAQAKRWRRALKSCLAPSASSYTKDSDFFSPERRKMPAQWYSTARFLYKDIKDALDSAKHEIFIAGWMITPELLLVRDAHRTSTSASSSTGSVDGDSSNMAGESQESNSESKASVKTEPAPRNASATLEAVLGAAVKRGVKVHVLIYRDVEIALPNNSLHAKHRLSAVGVQVIRHASAMRAIAAQNHLLPGFKGEASETWFSHHEKLVVVDQKIAFVGGIDLALGRFDDINHSLVDTQSGTRGNPPTWPGKDYYNVLVRDFCRLEEPHEDLIDRAVHPRMPWQDVHCCIGGMPARDVARHFIARWNRELKLGRSFTQSRKSAYRPLLPKVYPDLAPLLACDSLLPYRCDKVQVLRSVGPWSLGAPTEASVLNKYLELIRTAKKFIFIENQFFNHQVVVDALTDKCIQTFYAHREMTASRQRHTARSENGADDSNSGSAHDVDGKSEQEGDDDDTAFRIIVVTPQWPAFEGSPFSNPSTKIVLHFQHLAMDRVYHRMQAVGVPYDTARKMISFHALRKTGFLHGRLVSSQVYVHSKVIIADDTRCIIGSANLNKRSLNGDRDSEVCVYIEDQAFCKDLRSALFIQHLGLHPHVPRGYGVKAQAAKPSDADAAISSVALVMNQSQDYAAAVAAISKLPCSGCRLCSLKMRRSDAAALPSAAAAVVDDPFLRLWDRLSSRNLQVLSELLPGAQPRDEYETVQLGRRAEEQAAADGPLAADHATITLNSQLQGAVVDAPLGFLRKETKMLPGITDPSNFLLPLDNFV